MEDTFARFQDWLRDNGAEFSMLELRSYEDSVSSTRPILFNLEREMADEKKETIQYPPSILLESEMRGVHARQIIPPETVCLTIPRRCLITVEMGQATPIGQAILSADLDLDAPKHIFLMLYILWDRKMNGDQSFFSPYYNILPKSLRNMPIFWSQEELDYLQGSDMLDQIADRIEAITDDYFAICGVVPDFINISTLEEFKWARMCVCSRNFGLLIDGHRTSAMVPFADMLNHYRPRETKWTFDDDRDAFTITTIQGIPFGAQVNDSYGSKSNHRFLLNYGFAVEDNREVDGFCPNEVSVSLSVPPSDILYESKLELWTRAPSGLSQASFEKAVSIYQSHITTRGITHNATNNTTDEIILKSGEISASLHPIIHSGSAQVRLRSTSLDSFTSPIKNIRICVSSNHENNKILFSLCRVLACNEAELSSLSAPSAFTTNQAWNLLGFASSTSYNNILHRTCRDIRQPIGLRNEKEALKIMLALMEYSLSQYPTSLSQDKQDLLDVKTYPVFSNRRHAKIQVMGEKEVLHYFRCWCRAALTVVSEIEHEIFLENVKNDTVEESKFDQTVRALEDDLKMNEENKSIILRYCSDVLGALRRENLRKFRSSP